MANTAAIATSFKGEVLKGIHHFSAASGDVFRFALYYATATLGAASTVYTTTGEVTGTNYVALGVQATDADPATSGTVGYWTPAAAASWGTLSASAFDAALLFNDTAASNNAVAVFTFGSQTVTAGNFSLSMPANTSAAALLRIA